MNVISNFLLAQAAQTVDSVKCDPNNLDKLCNPLFHLGVADVPGLVAKVLNDLGGVIGLVAIAAVVYAGFRMVTANGDRGIIDNAKDTLKYAVYGFVAAVLAYAAVVAIENFIGVNDANYDSPKPQNPLRGFPDLKVFTNTMIRKGLLVIGLISLMMIILNGYRYMTARGNQTQVDDAKRALTWAIAGLVLSLFAYTLISVVARTIS